MRCKNPEAPESIREAIHRSASRTSSSCSMGSVAERVLIATWILKKCQETMLELLKVSERSVRDQKKGDRDNFWRHAKSSADAEERVWRGFQTPAGKRSVCAFWSSACKAGRLKPTVGSRLTNPLDPAMAAGRVIGPPITWFQGKNQAHSADCPPVRPLFPRMCVVFWECVCPLSMSPPSTGACRRLLNSLGGLTP